MTKSISLILLASVVFGCSPQRMYVETTSEYINNPSCWGGSLETRRGYLILMRQDEPFAFVLSKNCVVEKFAGPVHVLQEFSLLKISGASKSAQEALSIDENLGPNFLTSRPGPKLETSVKEITFSIEPREYEDFVYFEIVSLEVLATKPMTFEDLLS